MDLMGPYANLYLRYMATVSNKLIDQLSSAIRQAKVLNQNFYISDDLYARTTLEWVIEGLKGRLAKCLNADKGYCDIWYLESHSECMLLMDILYEYTEDPIYKPQMNNKSMWD